ncbi:MAG: hypothetical protein CL847_02245 [Crocinitomicaceae bacterium]|nr:hypothetical protein [Crocinitomicaceae bacterium]
MAMNRLIILVFTLLITCFIVPLEDVVAQDTTWVQTFTWDAQNNPETSYDSPGRRWFEFPASDNGEEYRKVLMYYNLKCFEDGTAGNLGYACGEWDYLTYNYLFDHTGLLDSTYYTHPLYKINNLDFEVENMVFEPEGGTPYNTVVSELSRTINEFDGSENIAEQEVTESVWEVFDFTTSQRIQMIYTADELVAMGLVTNQPIHEIRLPSTGFSYGVTTLRYQFTENETISQPVLKGWNEVYKYNTDYSFDVQFGLNQPIIWNGESNLLLDLSVENSSSISCDFTSAPDKVIAMTPQGRYVNFDGGDYMELLSSALQDLNDQITLELWLRGDESIPYNTTVFEGVNVYDQREINTHIPWSNSRVYWDAGYDGGYDRIDQWSEESELEGNWTHWAFVKNATEGTMSIVRDGQVWHTGENKDNLFGEIVRMFLGASAWNGNNYKGDVEDFRIWSEALDAETINEWRYTSDYSSHPSISNLMASYDFNGVNGTFENDIVGSPFGGYYFGNAGRKEYDASELFQDPFVPGGDSNYRPAFKFVQSDNVSTSQVFETIEEQVEVPPHSIVSYEVNGNSVDWTNIEYGWPEGLEVITTNQLGDTLSSYLLIGESFEYDNTSLLEYYGVPYEVIDRYEIGRFITPYGINLTLGPDGWTWIYDVTDYLPLLRDSVELEAGNWQELLDMKFAFIHGTPPRDVVDVERFWNGTYYLNNWDDNVLPYTFEAEAGEEMFKLVTRASGHGFGTGNNCAEFCYNTHTVKVDGIEHWSWEIMQECADNPLYPQGGTWIYDRAAWCPGDKVTQQDIELTGIVDDEFTVEYDITHDPHGNYRMEGQIISYGAPNMTHDVELMDIIAPNNRKVLSRWNPVCEDPIVLIRNNGTTPLSECVFEYGIEGSGVQTFTWTTSDPLEFLETREVSLPFNDPTYTEGGNEGIMTFMVSVDMVGDQENTNGLAYSQFERVNTYSYNDLDDNRIIIWVKTNLMPQETSTEIRNSEGEIIWSRTYDIPNTHYRDTLELNTGCYRFNVMDSDDDGISFWANNDGGGYARLKKVSGGNMYVIEEDFGKYISHAFRFETDLISDLEEVEESVVEQEVVVFPNPTHDVVKVKLINWTSDVVWKLRNAMGSLVSSGEFTPGSGYLLNIDMSALSSGVYSLSLDNKDASSLNWIVKK